MICLLQYAGPSALDARDNHGCTPFWYAAAAGHFKIIRLLDPSTNVHCKPNTGLTPLAIAALKGHPEVVRHLLDLNSYPLATYGPIPMLPTITGTRPWTTPFMVLTLIV
jgi:ankyrin repeat protein